MGWVKQQVRTNEDIFNEIASRDPNKRLANYVGDSTTPYEYWSDYLRDYYDVTLKQCDEICQMIREYYGIKKFYYNELYPNGKH